MYRLVDDDLVVASAEEQENDIRTATEDDQQQLRNLFIVIHFRSDYGSLRQSGPRPDPRLLRQATLEALTRSARTDSPRRIGRKQFSGEDGGDGACSTH
ncbi:hypothetical protein F511_44386 [Dorcoceras hygrometricum]|uniref:Uncharacterized protein n=1 Tax=Dorcoceras hygrometricum TaxID=472368 RepID=A0A2Z6ZXY6_9LAMI|nr:hypothetical protein F511_44386 [Dorcoceras hygrometricum]